MKWMVYFNKYIFWRWYEWNELFIHVLISFFFNHIMHVKRVCDLVTVNFVYLYFKNSVNWLTVWTIVGWNFWKSYKKIWNLLFALDDFQRTWIKIDDFSCLDGGNFCTLAVKVRPSTIISIMNSTFKVSVIISS